MPIVPTPESWTHCEHRGRHWWLRYERERLLRPLRTQPYVGNQVARVEGDGIEFADIRAFVAGDRLRSINWRASARRGELHVNEYVPGWRLPVDPIFA